MPITDDVRKYRETVLEQGKVALEEARKPWYAAVGAGDLAYNQIQAQLNQLPAEVQARLHKLQRSGTQIDAATVRSAVENAAGQAAGAYGSAAAQAKETYEALAHRGELAVRRLRRSPVVKSGFDQVEGVVGDAGKTVAAADEKVTKPGRATTPKPATTTTTASKAATGPRTTASARKTPAKRVSKS